MNHCRLCTIYKGQHGTGGQFGKTEKQEIFELHWMNNLKKKLTILLGNMIYHFFLPRFKWEDCYHLFVSNVKLQPNDI